MELEPSFADSAVVLLTSAAVQSILILIGLVALFMEINSPGFGLPGTVAIIAFVALFGTNMLMGTVGSLELVLFILGHGPPGCGDIRVARLRRSRHIGTRS